MIIRFPILLALAAFQGGVGAAPSDFTAGLELTADTLGVVSGARDRGASLLSKTVVFAGWQKTETEAYVALQYIAGDDLSAEQIGDAQVVSNLEARNGASIAEAWLARQINSGLMLKAGLIDLNTVFDVQQTGALFLNSSHGIGAEFSQIGPNGPSIYPTTGIAVVGRMDLSAGWTLKTGIFEGIPGDPQNPARTRFHFDTEEGLLLVGEVEKQNESRLRTYAGLWKHTARHERLAADNDRGSRNYGAYAAAEMHIWSPSAAPERGIDAWLRLGVARSSVNPIARYIGGGLTYTGVFSEQDSAGIAFARAVLSATERASGGLDYGETTLELTYSRTLFSRITLQPNIQYVHNPGADPALKNTLVAGLRLSLVLSAGD